MESIWQSLKILNPILTKAQHEEKIEALQLYFQQLWQMDNLVVLVGAGFTKYINGPLMSDLAREILPDIIWRGIACKDIDESFKESWCNLWQLDEKIWEKNESICTELQVIAVAELANHCAKLNIEEKTSFLQVIVNAFSALGINRIPYEIALTSIKKAIVDRMQQICPPVASDGFPTFIEKLQPYKDFIQRLVGYRRPQQPRVKFFTLNYDTIIETACDMNGITCVTGFEGRRIRVLNPTTFNLNTVFQATSESSIYYPNVIHLYKLHGSIDWHVVTVDGIPEIIEDDRVDLDSVVIYPCHTKFAEALDMPYYEMFRQLGEAVSRPQTVVLSLGYGFNDDHVNQLLLRAYKNPSCQLVLCEPRVIDELEPENRFLASMIRAAMPKEVNAATDPRVTVLGGATAQFPSILDVIFHPIDIESPSDEIRRLVKRLLTYGQQ